MVYVTSDISLDFISVEWKYTLLYGSSDIIAIKIYMYKNVRIIILHTLMIQGIGTL